MVSGFDSPLSPAAWTTGLEGGVWTRLCLQELFSFIASPHPLHLFQPLSLPLYSHCNFLQVSLGVWLAKIWFHPKGVMALPVPLFRSVTQTQMPLSWEWEKQPRVSQRPKAVPCLLALPSSPHFRVILLQTITLGTLSSAP